MSDPSPWIVEADAKNFQTKVVEPSRDRPTLIQFWAAWNEPSVALLALLEDRATQGAGRFLLAKVDADHNPELAEALQVRGLPATFAVVEGQLMRLFEGPIPAEELDRILDRLAPGLPGAAGGADPLAEARLDLEEGRPEEALARLDPWLTELAQEDQPEEALLLRVETLLDLGRAPEARERHTELPEALRMSAQGASLLARIEHAEGGVDLESLRGAVEADPADFDARMALGKALVAEKQYAEGFEEWLEALRLDPDGRGGEAKAALLAAFEVLGLEDPIANDYRFQLSLELFA